MKELLRAGKRMAVFVCLILIVCLPLVQAQTTQTTTLSPVIEADIPEFHNSHRIDIAGTTQAGADIQLFVNDVPVRSVTSSDGTFSFNSVPLNPNANNFIRIDGYLGGNFNSRGYNVYVDLVVPEITLDQEIPAASSSSSLTVSGTVSETSEVKIVLNNAELLSQETTSFSQSMALSEGRNVLQITAEDTAGNTRELNYEIQADTQPPTLDDVEPLEDATFYYEGRAITDVTGTTEPGAEVYMFVSPTYFPGGEPSDLSVENILGGAQYKVTADSDGSFRFNDVDFENPGIPLRIQISPQLADILGTGTESIGTTIPTYAPSPQQVPPSQLETSNQGIQVDDKTVKVYIIAVDQVGFTAQEAYSVSIGSCFSGTFRFGINTVDRYQTPALLSPGRLEDGTEIVSFVLGLNYNGNLPNAINASAGAGYWEVTGVQVEKACGSGFVDRDPSYKYACQLMGNNPTIQQQVNSEGTNWYFRYNLGSTDQFVERDDENFFEILDNYEMKFPLVVTVNYNEKQPGENVESKTQVACREVNYFVDVPIEPKQVLPDWMLTESRVRLNESINALDVVIERLDQVTRYVGLTCMGGVIIRFTMQFARRFSETWAISSCIADEVQSKIAGSDTQRKCFIKDTETLQRCYYVPDDGKGPIPEEAGNPLRLECVEQPASDEQNYVKGNPMINIEDSNNAQHFSTMADIWRAEADIYSVYRYVCDRTFCHAAPARWTQDESVADIRERQYEERACDPDASTARSLRKVDDCYQEFGQNQGVLSPSITSRYDIDQNTCYVLGNAVYKIKGQREGYTELERIDQRISGDSTSTPNTIIAYKKGDTYYTADTRKCETVCESKAGSGDWKGDCKLPTNPDVVAGKWYHYGPTSDCWDKTPKGKMECYCKEETEKAWGEELQTLQQKTWVAGSEDGGGDSFTPKELGGEWSWSYRQWQIYRDSNGQRGVYYPEERYYYGRDASAAFGMNYLPDYIIFGEPRTSEVNPFTQHVGAVQTACLTGILQRLRLLRNILTGLDNCFYQIQTTGEADAGVCKELLTQYVCNMVYQVYSLFQNKCTPADAGSTNEKDALTIQDFLGAGASALDGSLEDMSSELTEDYGNANLNNFLEGGTRSLTKKVCLAAFGYDVGFDTDSFIDASYSVPFRTSATVFSIHGQRGLREYLGFDPASRNALYEYRAAWTIFPGCDIESYRVELAAVTETERRDFNLDCSAVGEFGCDNLNGGAERIRQFATGSSLAQGDYKDDNNAAVISDQYRYDHIKIVLNLAPDWDAAKCFPPENRRGNQGIFYFPIYDASTRDIAQCSISPSSGQFVCSAFDLGTMAQAWIEDVKCQDPETKTWRDCGGIDFAATPTNETYDSLKVRADVFNTGEKQCLKTYVQTTREGQFPKTQVWWPVIGIGQPRSVPVEMQLISQIDAEEFGRTDFQLIPRNSLTLAMQSTPSAQVSPFDIYFATNDSNQAGKAVVNPNRYQITTSQAGVPNTWPDYNSGMILADPTGRFRFTVSDFDLNYTGQSGNYPYAKINVQPIATSSLPDQTWQIHLELYKPDANGYCNSGAAVKLTTPPGLGYSTDTKVKIKVKKQRLGTHERFVYSQGKKAYSEGNFVEAAAYFNQVVRLGQNSRENVLAIYWHAVSQIQADGENYFLHAQEIKANIDVFESRDKSNFYTSEVTSMEEYLLIKQYLGLIKQKLPSP